MEPPPLEAKRMIGFFRAVLTVASLALLSKIGAYCAAPLALLVQEDFVAPHAGMIRYPDVSAKHIVFTYAGNLWIVPRTGGVARPLTSAVGGEVFAKFSPDGSQVAFLGGYDAGSDIYTLPIEGGVPFRVTYHPGQEIPCDWTASGDILFFAYGRDLHGSQSQLMRVPATGGQPLKLPVPYGANGAISPDGKWLAYVLHSTDFSTWKRYTGGQATDIWLLNLETHQSKKITSWMGTDSLPMWSGDTVYYLSDDGPSHRLNIWAYDTKSSKRRQVTRYADFDVKWPSIGPGPDGKGEIVYQYGPDIRLLDLATGKSEKVEVRVPGARPTLKARAVNAARYLSSFDLSPTGKRVVVSARGDVWSLPAEEGALRNMTRTSGVFEREPTWSPDGKWIAYWSDESGEYELYLMPSDGSGETKKLTSLGAGFRQNLAWSPDSKSLVFQDEKGRICLIAAEGGEPKVVDTDGSGYNSRVAWSHDSSWLAYTKLSPTRLSAVWLYNVAEDKATQVTAGVFPDSWPVFDRKGDYLFLASNRNVTSPVFDEFGGWRAVYANTDVLLAVPLRKDIKSPFLPKSDEESFKKDTKPAGEGDKKDENAAENGEKKSDKPAGDGEKPKDEKKSLVIDLDGFEARAMRLPVPPGSFHSLNVTADGKLVYTRSGSGIKMFEMSGPQAQEQTVLAGVEEFTMSADGKKLLVAVGEGLAVISAAPNQKAEKMVPMQGMTVSVEPREEWKQIFNDAWRLFRDYFYAANMHGVDWPAVREQYAQMLEDCSSRGDLNYILGEMLGELNVGHAYIWNVGDVEQSPPANVGLLGCDYELHRGAYRISRILGGAPWDDDARGPLGQPGVDVKVGDYVLAVNGTPVDASKEIHAAFLDTAGRTITITVSENPVIDEKARDVVVRPIPNEGSLRYRTWVEKNRKYVEEKSGGRVGYIHVPDTGTNGMNELNRQFIGQMNKEALIVDERWNGGGQSPDKFIELLNRPALSYFHTRNGRNDPVPGISHLGPKCMLINSLAGSGGDAFPYYFRKAGVGKLIGTRTWGGLVGLSWNPELIDGGALRVPRHAFFETDGTWGVEGYGVAPDIEVVDDPALMVDGSDPQLDAAIRHMLDELKRRPYVAPKTPEYPDRSGIGVQPKDR